MKKLIKICDDFYAVDNSKNHLDGWKIPIGEWYLDDAYQIRRSVQQENNRLWWSTRRDYLQIEMTTNHLLTGATLLDKSEIEETVYGYSLDNLAKGYCVGGPLRNRMPVDEMLRNETTFKEGFKAHRKLSKDKIHEVIKLLKNITEWSSFKDHPIGKQAQMALDLLIPPTEWNIEINEQGKITLL